MSDRIIVLTNRPSVIKKIYDLPFDDNINRRSLPNYETIYNSIWEDLNE